MSRNRKYHLRRVAKMQERVKAILAQHPGLPYTEIYRQYIEKEFDIGYSTFCNWLGYTPTKDLKELELINQ